jgi:hypothetical protein
VSPVVQAFPSSQLAASSITTTAVVAGTEIQPETVTVTL